MLGSLSTARRSRAREDPQRGNVGSQRTERANEPPTISFSAPAATQDADRITALTAATPLCILKKWVLLTTWRRLSWGTTTASSTTIALNWPLFTCADRASLAAPFRLTQGLAPRVDAHLRGQALPGHSGHHGAPHRTMASLAAPSLFLHSRLFAHPLLHCRISRRDARYINFLLLVGAVWRRSVLLINCRSPPRPLLSRFFPSTLFSRSASISSEAAADEHHKC